MTIMITYLFLLPMLVHEEEEEEEEEEEGLRQYR